MEERFEKVFDQFMRQKQIKEAICHIENTDGSFCFQKCYGERTPDKPYLLASITKMFTAACIFRLLQEQKVSLDDNLQKYFDKNLVRRLLVYKEIDFTDMITLKHLLLQSTGFADEYEECTSKSKRLALLTDRECTLETVIESTKQLKPHFSPCEDKAHYANINYDLLGGILEKVMDQPLEEVYKTFIFEPLGLKETFLFTEACKVTPYVYFEDERLILTQILAGSKASGGLVSTSREVMRFLKAFFEGKLFDTKIRESLANYRKLQPTMGPLYYGPGYMWLPLKGALTTFRDRGEMVGHVGTTDSFAFYYPREQLYFVGDLCQLANPALPIRLLLKLICAI